MGHGRAKCPARTTPRSSRRVVRAPIPGTLAADVLRHIRHMGHTGTTDPEVLHAPRTIRRPAQRPRAARSRAAGCQCAARVGAPGRAGGPVPAAARGARRRDRRAAGQRPRDVRGGGPAGGPRLAHRAGVVRPARRDLEGRVDRGPRRPRPDARRAAAGRSWTALETTDTPEHPGGPDGASRHRAAVGRRLRRLPGAGRRPQRSPSRRPARRPGRPGQLAGRRPGGRRTRRCSRPWQTPRSRPSSPAPSGAPTSRCAAPDRGTPARSRPASCTTPPARTATPRPTSRRSSGHLRVPRQGQRLVGHRLQLPRRPLRPALGGPLRRHRP